MLTKYVSLYITIMFVALTMCGMSEDYIPPKMRITGHYFPWDRKEKLSRADLAGISMNRVYLAINMVRRHEIKQLDSRGKLDKRVKDLGEFFDDALLKEQFVQAFVSSDLDSLRRIAGDLYREYCDSNGLTFSSVDG